jgi:hypothetical protein
MTIRTTVSALVVAVVLAGPTPSDALEAFASSHRIPLDNEALTLVQSAQGSRGRSQPPRDTAERDSAAGRGGGAPGRQGGPAGQQAQQDAGFSLLRLAAMAVIAIMMIGAALFVYVMFWRTRSETRHEIPIVFQPRAHVPAVPEFPQPTRFRPPAPEPVILHPAGNNTVFAPQPAAPTGYQGTMQLLPGRLVITSGLNNQKEFRFVRVPGSSGVTFGRYPGEQHTHIQVDSPTVSRKHASMRFHQGEWRITNLSSTNPVVVNGEQLPTDEERVLKEGDQVEMGEVIFRFHAR